MPTTPHALPAVQHTECLPGDSRGDVARVKFSSPQEAAAAVERLQGARLQGCQLYMREDRAEVQGLLSRCSDGEVAEAQAARRRLEAAEEEAAEEERRGQGQQQGLQHGQVLHRQTPQPGSAEQDDAEGWRQAQQAQCRNSARPSAAQRPAGVGSGEAQQAQQQRLQHRQAGEPRDQRRAGEPRDQHPEGDGRGRGRQAERGSGWGSGRQAERDERGMPAQRAEPGHRRSASRQRPESPEALLGSAKTAWLNGKPVLVGSSIKILPVPPSSTREDLQRVFCFCGFAQGHEVSCSCVRRCTTIPGRPYFALLEYHCPLQAKRALEELQGVKVRPGLRRWCPVQRGGE